MRKLALLLTLSLCINFGSPADVAAQCPMCKISAESNLNNGGTAGSGLNKGILYLFALPYLIIGGIGYYWYKNKQDLTQDQIEQN